MKVKAAAALAASALVLLAALAFLAAAANGAGYENLLLAVPLKTGSPGLDIQKLDEFCEEEFLVTYEIRQEKNVRAVNSGHSVTMIGTNACYQSVLSYPMLEGGFFTKSAWDAKERHAVLNETAAFRLFGGRNIAGKTLQIGGKTWLVKGIMRDNDEDNANIYAPSCVTGGTPQSLMALTGGAVTEAYAKNALKSLGVRDTSYEFYNLSRLASTYGEYFSVAWKAAVFLLAVLAAIKAAILAVKRLRGIKSRLREQYLSDIAEKNRTDLLKTAGCILLAAGGAAAALAMSVQILETCLGWDKARPAAEITAYDFMLKLAWLQDYRWAGIALLTAFLCVVILLFCLTFASSRPE